MMYLKYFLLRKEWNVSANDTTHFIHGYMASDMVKDHWHSKRKETCYFFYEQQGIFYIHHPIDTNVLLMSSKLNSRILLRFHSAFSNKHIHMVFRKYFTDYQIRTVLRQNMHQWCAYINIPIWLTIYRDEAKLSYYIFENYIFYNKTSFSWFYESHNQHSVNCT